MPVNSFTSRKSVDEYINSIKDHPDYEKLKREAWVSWARHLRPMRTAAILQHLILTAESGTTTTYSEVDQLLRHGSHNEQMLLINYVGEICRANNWPALPILIKNKETGKVGTGFFKAYPIAGKPVPTQDDLDFEERRHTEDCYNRVPDQIQVQARLMEYIAKRLIPMTTG